MQPKSQAIAHVFTVPAKTPEGYRWQWRSADGATTSENAFDLFYDCVSDARESGYEVDLAEAPGSLPAASRRRGPDPVR